MNGISLASVIHHCHEQQQIQANARQWQVLHHIEDCRTERMGTGKYQCYGCGHHWFWHHSCRDRHCPQCQKKASEQWLLRQEERCLPVPYFHLVFTLPHELNAWIAKHDRVIYDTLFQAAWRALNELSQRKHKGRAGMTAVLHTWGQTLVRHVHLHALVPSGVYRDQGWHSLRKHYFLPVKLLSNRFRGAMVSQLRAAFSEGLLPSLSKAEVSQLLNVLMQKPWVVYCKSAIEYRSTLVAYLARYSHRIALSNNRFQVWNNDKISLQYRDYRSNKQSLLTLTPQELVRRFLLHVLPRGFMRIRHYGCLSNAIRAKVKKRVDKQLDRYERRTKEDSEKVAESGCSCPVCGERTVTYLGDVSESKVTERLSVMLPWDNGS
ncbi:IS91 family transposase [Marinomonas ostreistagni]|nr:transposase [Marinomonas ostreistagni]